VKKIKCGMEVFVFVLYCPKSINATDVLERFNNELKLHTEGHL
jgi:hypothetical protein